MKVRGEEGHAMFEIEIHNTKFWQSCIDALVNLVEEGTFSIDAKSIGLKALDPSKIAMVVFTAPSSAFASYRVESPTRIALNLDNYRKVIASARADERILMKYAERKIIIDFVKEKSKRTFSLPLLEPEPEHHEPKLKELTAVVTMTAGELKSILRDAQLVASHIVFDAKNNALSIEAKGEESDLSVSLENLLSLSVRTPSRAMYPLQYLIDMLKAASDETPVTLSYATDIPIVVEYPIGDARVKYFLAPRSEE